MSAKPARKGLLRMLGLKPAKPSACGNAEAFKVGRRAFQQSHGSTPGLQRVVKMSLENEDRAKG